MVFRKIPQNTVKCAYFQRIMRRNRNVVNSILLGGKAHMASGLTSDGITKFGKRFRKVIAGLITW